MIKRTRFSRATPWFLGAAIAWAPLLSGCDSGSRIADGTPENIPKQSPVLGPGKDSAAEFFKNKKGAAAPKAPAKK